MSSHLDRRQNFIRSMLYLILTLLNNLSFTRKMVILVIQLVEHLLCDVIIEDLIKLFKNILQNKVDEKIITSVVLALRDHKFYFNELNTKNKLTNFLVAQDLLIEPNY